MPFESEESSAVAFLILGFCLGFMYTRGGLVGETYERRSVSSWELNKRVVEPLFGMLEGVFSFELFE